MNNVKQYKYTPTHHAVTRAAVRFGIDSDKVIDWVNELMQKAKYVAASGKHRITFEHDGVQIIVDTRNNAVVTVHNVLRADFLKPTLEREIRKIKRESTRQIRLTEKRLAKAYAELSDKLMNYANARNPNTRKSIGVTIEQNRQQIDDLTNNIERQKDELSAKIKAIEVITE